jgi:ribonuclease P/MRP protein subunit POP1
VCVALRRFDNEFLTFEITGQRATEVIKAVLKPTNAERSQTSDSRMHAHEEGAP